MEMVGMGRVIVRAESRREGVAGPVARAAQEAGLVVVTLPIPQHADARPVFQDETGDVDRIAGGMFAPRPTIATVETAAGIGAKMLYSCDIVAEYLLRGRFQAIGPPEFQRDPDRAGRGRARGRKRIGIEPGPVGPRARPLPCLLYTSDAADE